MKQRLIQAVSGVVVCLYEVPKQRCNTICIYKTVQLYSLRLCSIAALRDFFGLKYKCYWYNMLVRSVFSEIKKGWIDILPCLKSNIL